MGDSMVLRISLFVAIVAAVAILLKQGWIGDTKYGGSGVVRVGKVMCNSFADHKPACCGISETACGLLAMQAVMLVPAPFNDDLELEPLWECGGCGCLGSDVPPCCHGQVPSCYSH